MSVYDDMYGCIEGALSTDTCDYSVYSEMCDLIAEAEAENAKLRELVSLMDKRDVLLPCRRGCDADCRFHGSHCERIGTLMDELGIEVCE